jgi:signal peptidase II
MTTNSGPKVGGAILAVGVLAVDQATKVVVLNALAPGNSLPVTPFLNLQLGFNEGISFGLFSEMFAGRPLILAALAALIVLFLAGWLWTSKRGVEAVALGAILGGAMSNIADRVRIGAVVDYLDFHIWGYHWPAFNLADASIVCGTVAFVLGELSGRTNKL